VPVVKHRAKTASTPTTLIAFHQTHKRAPVEIMRLRVAAAMPVITRQCWRPVEEC
jgi:hypothetical protein